MSSGRTSRANPFRRRLGTFASLGGMLGLGLSGIAFAQDAVPSNPLPFSPVPTLKLPDTVPGNSPKLFPAAAVQAPMPLPTTPMPKAVAPAQVPPASTPSTQLPTPTPAGSGSLMDAIRNPLLSPTPTQARSPGKPTAEIQKKFDRHIQDVLDPEMNFDLVAGQTRVLMLKNNVFRVQAGDESMVSVSIVNPREILVQGRAVGSTVLNLWFGDADDPTKQETITYLVRVYPDPEAKERLERAYKALEADINRYFKDAEVRLAIVGDKLLVSGRVHDAQQGTKILRIINAGADQNHQGGSSGNGGGDAALLPVEQSDALFGNTIDSYRALGGMHVVNLLEVAGEQQVALRVIVAEVNRAAARSLGMNFSVRNNQGVTVFSNQTGRLNGYYGGGGGFGGGFGGSASGLGFRGTANIGVTLDAGQIPIAIEALKTLSYAKSLAEPTLVTMNGQPANFLAGGRFPVPIITGNTFNGLQGVTYIPYGVSLNFVPYITDRDRIRLSLNASVSSRDVGSSTNIGGANVSGLNTRNVSTTVELRQGETLAVAGLIEANQGGDSTRLPIIGDLPIIGPLTGVNRVSSGEKELIIFITPVLTRPLDVGQVPPPLPGAEIVEPSDFEFYIVNRLEGHCRNFRSPIRTDLGRLRQYQLMEETYLSGPIGYTGGPALQPQP